MTTAQSIPNLSNDARRDAWRVLLPARQEPSGGLDIEYGTRRFAVLPSRNSPRWYVPLDSRQYAAGAAALYQPSRRRARVTASVLRFAARFGALRWYPSHLAVHVPGVPTLETLMGELTACPNIRLAIYSGRPGRTRTTVLVAGIAPDGNVEAFARIAVASAGDFQIREEARKLSALNAVRAPAPELLWAGEVDGREGLIQQAIHGIPSCDTWTTAHDKLLARLVHGEARPMSESGLVARVRSETQADPRLGEFSGTLAGAAEILRECTARPVINHGDFAPWNILSNSSGGLTAIDWESAELDGLPYLDRLYFDIATGVLLQGWNTERLVDYLTAWSASGHVELPERQATALLTVFLLERLLRSSADGLDEAHVLIQGLLRTLRHLDTYQVGAA